MNQFTEIKAGVAAMVGALSMIWGWLGWLVVGWVVCMAIDYISGSAAAAKAGEWSSAKARDGIWHKAGMIVVVIVAALCDMVVGIMVGNLPVNLPFTYETLILPIVLIWYIFTELGSIAENAVKMGAPVPSALVQLLKAGKRAAEAALPETSGDEAEEEE